MDQKCWTKWMFFWGIFFSFAVSYGVLGGVKLKLEICTFIYEATFIYYKLIICKIFFAFAFFPNSRDYENNSHVKEISKFQ